MFYQIFTYLTNTTPSAFEFSIVYQQ